MLSLYLAAEEAVLTGQSYSIGNRSLTRANLGEIRKARQEWETTVARLTNGTRGARVMRVVPRDY
jgi:hypothetical protein